MAFKDNPPPQLYDIISAWMELTLMDTNVVIDIDHVTHRYSNETSALQDVNLQLRNGIFGLLGTNGAGKSTLMNIICTLLDPSEGKVTVGGFDTVKDRFAVRKLIGYLPQKFGAWKLHSVEDVLNTLAKLSGIVDKNIRKQRISQVLASVGLENLAKKKVKELSGGMVRRLGIAQSLIHEPKVLIMDEPTVGLDPEERLRFRHLLASLSKDSLILLSTHIVADLSSNCSEIAIIEKGQLQFCGQPAELIKQAQGSVVEIPEINNRDDDLDGWLEIVSRQDKRGQSILRGVLKNKAAAANTTLQEADTNTVSDITLEEAYLAFSMR